MVLVTNMSRITFSFAHSGGTSFARSVLPPVFRVEVVAAVFVRLKNMSPQPRVGKEYSAVQQGKFSLSPRHNSRSK